LESPHLAETNTKPKPSVDELMPPSQIEQKVRPYLGQWQQLAGKIGANGSGAFLPFAAFL
jgi:hypothetical protein